MNGQRNSDGGDFRAEVLSAVNIVELIGQTVALKRRGKDFVGLCPFHQEKSPSFKVDPVKQYFYCFGCKASGTAIDFVMKRDRVEFIDALRSLGQIVGLEMPQRGGSREKAGQRQQLLDACSSACALFEKLLADSERGLAARNYLSERGFDAESVKRFQIGFAPDAWDTIASSPIARKLTPPVLALAGLIKPRNQGEGYYDTFRNRLMFPIRDDQGRVIAFGGRVMPGSEDPAKYLNSPETPLFSKSRSVFGLDLARQKIVETRTVAVVEGYTDVVMAHQFGATNVVSILGTAMTEPHVAILRRFADRIVLLFDADTAGDTAVNRAVELFLTQPVEIGIAAMPDGVDPDEFLLKHGTEAFANVLSDAADALTFKWKQLNTRFHAADDLTGRQKAVEEYLALLAAARGSGPVDGLRWGQALARVSRLTEISIEELNRRFKMKAASTKPRPTVAVATSEPTEVRKRGDDNRRERAERWVLGILLQEPQRWQIAQQHLSPQQFTTGRCGELAELYWNYQRDEGEPVLSELLGLIEDDDLKSLALELVQDLDELQREKTNRMKSSVPTSVSLDITFDTSIEFLRGTGQRDDKKLIAELRRTDKQTGEQDEVSLLRSVAEQARKPVTGLRS